MRRLLHLCVAVAALAGPLAAAQQEPRDSLPTLGPLDASGQVPYFISRGEPDSGYRDGDADLARWALAAWQRATGNRITFAPSLEDQALLRVYWVPAGAGRYGEMKGLQLGDRRGAAVFIRPDTNELGPVMAAAARDDELMRDTIVYLTCLHELGHAVGLTHTADIRDVMYSFQYGGDITEFFRRYRDQVRTRDDVRKVAGLSESDRQRAQALYPAR